MNRHGVSALLLGLVLMIPLDGSAAKKDKSEVAVSIDSTFFAHPLKSVGFLPMLTPSVDDERVDMIQELVEGELQEKGDFTLLFPQDVKSAAERSGAKDAFATLLRVWQQRRIIDPPAMETVAATLGLDAIVGVEVTHWEQYKLDLETEGNSTTTVGLKVSVHASDRTRLWEASRVYVAKSPPYNPSNSMVSDAAGQARAAGRAGTPDPPEFETTAERVVKEVMATWPTEKGKRKKEKK